MNGCEVCNAKQRKRISYGSKKLCSTCFYEYQMIFEGVLSNKVKRRMKHIQENPNDNPMFREFKEGWERHERDNNLPPLEIPKFIKDIYRGLAKQKNRNEMGLGGDEVH